MIKDDSVYLRHMLDQAVKVVSKLESKTRAEFDSDENLRLALAHLIQTIGEAARRVSDATREGHPELPWKQIMGMRHKIVHDYMNVNENILWVVATEHMVPLIEQLILMVEPEESG
jgi:uncharacterized protein with HEPN domain